MGVDRGSEYGLGLEAVGEEPREFWDIALCSESGGKSVCSASVGVEHCVTVSV